MHVAAKKPDRLVEYIVQVGMAEPLVPLMRETEIPITDVCIVYDRAPVPAGFEKLEFSVSGGSGNLCAGGNVFSSAVWLCVKREKQSQQGAITDLTLVWRGRDDGGKMPHGWVMLESDLNQGSYGYNIALCYTRQKLPGSHTGAVLDIGIVNLAKHDVVPPRYKTIGAARRNVNAGSFRDEINLVVKHAIKDPVQIKYKPAVLDRYPRTEHPGAPLPLSIALFSSPSGIELVHSSTGPPQATYSSFVLTTEESTEMYCSCITFWEQYDGELPPVRDPGEEEESRPTTRAQAVAAAQAQLLSPVRSQSSGNLNALAASGRTRSLSSDSLALSSSSPNAILYSPRKICLLSYWAYFANFNAFLEELYRHSRRTSKAPIERVIRQLLDAPLPGSGRMRVQIELGATTHAAGSFASASAAAAAVAGVSSTVESSSHTFSSLFSHPSSGRLLQFDRPMPDEFPLINFPLTLLFRTLSLSNILILISAILQEKKIILTSRVAPLLTYTSESLRSLLFPLCWTHPYIPVLPRPMLEMIEAPMPVWVGVEQDEVDARQLSGEDMVIAYLDRDELRIGGNGKDAYSTNSVAHAAINAAVVAAASLGKHQSALASVVASAGSSSSSSHAGSSSSSYSPDAVPDKVPHITLLPRKLLQRLVHELRVHTNVTRLKKFQSDEERRAYFTCFRGHTTSGVNGETDPDELLPPDEMDVTAHEHGDDTPGGSRGRTPAEGRSRAGSDGGHPVWTSGAGSGTSNHYSPATSTGDNILAIRACFLHVFISLLGGMESYLRFPAIDRAAFALANSHGNGGSGSGVPSFAQLFDVRSFLDASESKWRPFLRQLTMTQMFSYYVEEKTDCTSASRAMELAFFSHAVKYSKETEQQLEQARKRGLTSGKEAPTLGVVVYLSQQSSNRTTYTVPPPDTRGLHTTPSETMFYSYPNFPRRFDTALLNKDGSVEATSKSVSSTEASSSFVPPPSTPPRTLSDTADEGVVLYSPEPEEKKDNGLPPPQTPQHVKQSSSFSILSSSNRPPMTPQTVSTQQHVKSLSSGAVPSPYPASVMNTPARPTSQTALPPQRSSTTGPASAANGAGMNGHAKTNSQTQFNLSASSMQGSRVFTGARGPTAAVFRSNSGSSLNGSSTNAVARSDSGSSLNGASSTAVARASSTSSLNGASTAAPQKKDTLHSFLDFISSVKQKAPPTPQKQQLVQRTAPSTPQRTAPNTPQRTAPSTPMQTAPSTPTNGPRGSTLHPAHQSPNLGPRAAPSVSDLPSFPRRALDRTPSTASASNRAASVPRGRLEGSEAPLRAPNFVSASEYAMQQTGSSGFAPPGAYLQRRGSNSRSYDSGSGPSVGGSSMIPTSLANLFSSTSITAFGHRPSPMKNAAVYHREAHPAEAHLESVAEAPLPQPNFSQSMR